MTLQDYTEKRNFIEAKLKTFNSSIGNCPYTYGALKDLLNDTDIELRELNQSVERSIIAQFSKDSAKSKNN